LLEGAEEPKPEVEEIAIYNINRRPFRGDNAIRIVADVLNIDFTKDPIYQLGGGRQNFSG